MGYRFVRGVINVDKRVTYEDANAILERGDKDIAKDYRPCCRFWKRCVRWRKS